MIETPSISGLSVFVVKGLGKRPVGTLVPRRSVCVEEVRMSVFTCYIPLTIHVPLVYKTVYSNGSKDKKVLTPTISKTTGQITVYRKKGPSKQG